ncbi:hypothetical protein lbkm_0458 [Lachnospiraceae bacterium KM106-2]|nr:hypothetical protein lbkm_0458 [Lachnospiraceae bacterium KM106-2]
MKLELQQDNQVKETEVRIRYAQMDSRIDHMVTYIRQYDHCIEVSLEGEHMTLPLETIYYMDCADGRTFVYDQSKVYECKQTIRQLAENLADTSFVQISKNCIMNTSYLKSFKPYPNHRLLAKMKNNEKLIVSRKYIDQVKESIRRGWNA